MSLAERKWLRIGTLLALYVAQGIPWGFTATTLPAYIADKGVTPAALSDAFVATTLPYSFKWIWGPIVDAVRLPGGRRRPWIIVAQLLMALTIGAMLLAGDLDKDLSFLATLVLVHTVFNALQDVATDGLAVDMLDENERGRVNGMLYAAKYGGGVIGGAGLANVIEWSTLNTALVVQVVILLGIMMVPLLVKESDAPVEKATPAREVVTALAEALATRRAFGLAIVMLLATFAQGTLSVISTTLLTQELNWDAAQVTELTGGWGLAVGLGGSLLGGFLADKIGHRRLAMQASLSMAVAWLVFVLGQSLWHYDEFIYAFMFWEQLSLSIMTVSSVALCMGVVTPRAAASQFAAYMALSNFSSTLGYSAPQWLPESWTTRDFYIAAIAIQAVVTVLFGVLVTPPKPASELPPSRARGYLALSVLATLLAGLTAFVVWRRLSG